MQKHCAVQANSPATSDLQENAASADTFNFLQTQGTRLFNEELPVTEPTDFLREAVRLAHINRSQGGRPFGAVLVRNGAVLATGVNGLVQSGDPTSHAEMQALRAAGIHLRDPKLHDCVVYASGLPCPMCLAAMVMSGIQRVFYAFDNDDAAPYGLSSAAAYAALGLPLNPPPLPLVRLETGVTAEQLYGPAPAPAALGTGT